MISLAAVNSVLSKPSNPVQHRSSKAVNLRSISSLLQKILDSASQIFRVRVNDRISCDVAAVHLKRRVVYGWIPVLSLPSINTITNHIREIIVISDVWETKCRFEFCFGSVVVAKEDIIHHVGNFLGIEDA